MISLNRNSKIYVYCPSNIVTGGAELLHQLVHVLNESQIDAYIVYFNGNSKIPNEYKKYNLKIENENEIEDYDNNVVVLYEAIFDYSKLYNNVKYVFWWLSVDNYFYCTQNPSFLDYYSFNKIKSLKLLLRKIKRTFFNKNNNFKDSISLKDIEKTAFLNCYQSEYAQNFLLKNNFSQILPLSDFINTDFLQDKVEIDRKNIILYNPKKGFEYTKKLIALRPDFEWIPLIGLSVEQMVNLFKTSKLYIDFGFHPGKDRIPREAVLNGCCIITGRKGSANFFEDVAILDKYKIDEKNQSKSDVIEMIEKIFEDFDGYSKDFEFYRNRILKEESLFKTQVEAIFTKNDI